MLTTSYLGKPEPTVTINFSRNSGNIAASYYNVSALCHAFPYLEVAAWRTEDDMLCSGRITLQVLLLAVLLMWKVSDRNDHVLPCSSSGWEGKGLQIS